MEEQDKKVDGAPFPAERVLMIYACPQEGCQCFFGTDVEPGEMRFDSMGDHQPQDGDHGWNPDGWPRCSKHNRPMLPVRMQALESVEIDKALNELEDSIEANAPRDPEQQGGFPRLTHEQRDRLHRLASSLHDMTFWVFPDERHPPLYRACEIESGVCAWGVDAQQAVEHYFSGHLLTAAEVLEGHRADPESPAALRTQRNEATRRATHFFQALAAIYEVLEDDELRFLVDSTIATIRQITEKAMQEG